MRSMSLENTILALVYNQGYSENNDGWYILTIYICNKLNIYKLFTHHEGYDVVVSFDELPTH